MYLGFGFLSRVDLRRGIGSLGLADDVLTDEVAGVLAGEVTGEISGEPSGEVAYDEFPEEFSSEPVTASVGYETR